jgi:methionine-rich copper-binding protein CopC
MRTTLLALVLLSTTGAFGHALLLESTPAANAAVSGPELAIRLKFNTRIDVEHSRLRVVLADHSVRRVVIGGVAGGVVRATVKDLRPGTYRLQWQVLATDGHITRGEVPFAVK